MRVIVTGGAGFIGSWTAEALVGRGHEVVIMDDLSTGDPRNLSRIAGRAELIRVDVRNPDAVDEVFRRVGPDAVIHLAAVVSVDEVAENPVRGFEINVRGTLNLLEAARKHGVERFVYASSAAVYGDPVRLPITEEHPTRPKNVYGATKLAGEALVNAYVGNYGLSTAVLRYFNVYGPRMRAGPYSGVIRKFTEAILADKPITIFGDGEQTRDFIYVEDVARANLAALESGATGTYNIGTGEPIRIADLAHALMNVAGKEVPIKYAPPRPGDIRHSYADISKARKELGWSPETRLEEGLKRTIEFIRRSLS